MKDTTISSGLDDWVGVGERVSWEKELVEGCKTL